MARHGVCQIIADYIASYSVVKIGQVIRERFSFCTCHLPGTTWFSDGLIWIDCSPWAMIAAQKRHFSSFLKTCFACFCCRCQGFLKVVQAWHVRDPLHQTGKHVNQLNCISLYFIVKLCLLEIRTKRWVMLGHVLHHSHSSFSQESTRKCCGG